MIALLNGEEGSVLSVFKGSTALVQGFLCSDGEVGPTGQVTAKGTALDVTGDTISLEVYDTADRRNAAVKSIAATLVTAASGLISIGLTAVNMDFGPGTYYAYVKRSENTGSTIEFSRKYTTIKVS